MMMSSRARGRPCALARCAGGPVRQPLSVRGVWAQGGRRASASGRGSGRGGGRPSRGGAGGGRGERRRGTRRVRRVAWSWPWCAGRCAVQRSRRAACRRGVVERGGGVSRRRAKRPARRGQVPKTRRSRLARDDARFSLADSSPAQRAGYSRPSVSTARRSSCRLAKTVQADLLSSVESCCRRQGLSVSVRTSESSDDWRQRDETHLDAQSSKSKPCSRRLRGEVSLGQRRRRGGASGRGTH